MIDITVDTIFVINFGGKDSLKNLRLALKFTYRIQIVLKQIWKLSPFSYIILMILVRNQKGSPGELKEGGERGKQKVQESEELGDQT